MHMAHAQPTIRASVSKVHPTIADTIDGQPPLPVRQTSPVTLDELLARSDGLPRAPGAHRPADCPPAQAPGRDAKARPPSSASMIV